ncbi:DUF3237 family protein [Oceanobacillus rekensis]|uniref:DUF3237 family protein n=1 Tax=Oceanobacillus rekensis TaxID=937927 RepID=UPI002481E87B|nr:DUF3237 family protein [Oceanobacillus rekensis]
MFLLSQTEIHLPPTHWAIAFTFLEEGDFFRSTVKTTPTFETSSEKYGFLNRMIVVGEGIRRPSNVEMVFYLVE